MEEKEAQKHLKASRVDEVHVEPNAVWGDAVQDIVDKRAREIAQLHEWIG